MRTKQLTFVSILKRVPADTGRRPTRVIEKIFGCSTVIFPVGSVLTRHLARFPYFNHGIVIAHRTRTLSVALIPTQVKPLSIGRFQPETFDSHNHPLVACDGAGIQSRPLGKERLGRLLFENRTGVFSITNELNQCSISSAIGSSNAVRNHHSLTLPQRWLNCRLHSATLLLGSYSTGLILSGCTRNTLPLIDTFKNPCRELEGPRTVPF